MKILVALLLFVTLNANSTSLALYNFSNGQLESSHRHEEIVAIASVTKLFTAASVLESGVNIHEKVKVQGKTKGRFAQGTMVTRLELLKAMLIASDNLAADSLAYSHPGGYREFINHTNTFIGSIGLKNTKIFDASGLSVFNVSSADELVNFVWYLRHYPLITDISSRASDELEFDNNRRKTVKLQIKNTNPDINKYNVLISKTGFTNAAGRCLVMLIQKGDDVLGIAVLGFKNPKTRSEAVSQLINFK
jgi:D-alanyl-D-alanine endopeptidase (penicillin-binding protein 7)